MFKLAVLLAVVAVAHARPGGYLATGGIYNPDRELDYMEEARSAGEIITACFPAKYLQHLLKQKYPT